MYFSIKKIRLLLLSASVILFYSCEKKFDNIIDSTGFNYQVLSVSPKDTVVFNLEDSSLVINIKFSQSSKLNSVSAQITDPVGKKYISDRLSLFDNGKSENGDLISGDKIYSNKIFMKSNDQNGVYDLKFYVDDEIEINRFVARTSFYFRNGESNVAPVISNPSIDPDTLVVTTTTTIQTRIKVEDQNGLNDIKEVYFIVFRPDGTTNNIKTQLYDDGNLNDNGDLIAGDGIYSRKIKVNETNAKGTYRFEFRANDRGGLQSNIINYFVLIQ